MLKLLLHGALGVMGSNVVKCCAAEEDIEIVCGVDKEDRAAGGALPFPVYSDFSYVKEDFDVIVDFSVAAAADRLLSYVSESGKPLVLCTTGLSEAQLEKMREASKAAPVLRSANMSIGVNLLLKLVREAANALYQRGFDIEIVEQHHKRKLDAPSGTALALSEAAKEGINDGIEQCKSEDTGKTEGINKTGDIDRTGNSEDFEKIADVFGRSDRLMARPHAEIGISSVRGGTIPGVHEVVFAGEDEVIGLSHTAYSRMIFAKGALAAARFLSGKAPGLYDMQDVLSL